MQMLQMEGLTQELNVNFGACDNVRVFLDLIPSDTPFWFYEKRQLTRLCGGLRGGPGERTTHRVHILCAPTRLNRML